MSNFNDSIEEISKLKKKEYDKISESSITSICFSSVSNEIKRVYEILKENHSKGEKTPNEMYIDAIRAMESIQSFLPGLQKDVLNFVSTTKEKILIYDNCIEVLKKTNLKNLTAEDPENDLKS